MDYLGRYYDLNPLVYIALFSPLMVIIGFVISRFAGLFVYMDSLKAALKTDLYVTDRAAGLALI